MPTKTPDYSHLDWAHANKHLLSALDKDFIFLKKLEDSQSKALDKKKKKLVSMDTPKAYSPWLRRKLMQFKETGEESVIDLIMQDPEQKPTHRELWGLETRNKTRWVDKQQLKRRIGSMEDVKSTVHHNMTGIVTLDMYNGDDLVRLEKSIELEKRRRRTSRRDTELDVSNEDVDDTPSIDFGDLDDPPVAEEPTSQSIPRQINAKELVVGTGVLVHPHSSRPPSMQVPVDHITPLKQVETGINWEEEDNKENEDDKDGGDEAAEASESFSSTLKQQQSSADITPEADDVTPSNIDTSTRYHPTPTARKVSSGVDGASPFTLTIAKNVRYPTGQPPIPITRARVPMPMSAKPSRKVHKWGKTTVKRPSTGGAQGLREMYTVKDKVTYNAGGGMEGMVDPQMLLTLPLTRRRKVDATASLPAESRKKILPLSFTNFYTTGDSHDRTADRPRISRLWTYIAKKEKMEKTKKKVKSDSGGKNEVIPPTVPNDTLEKVTHRLHKKVKEGKTMGRARYVLKDVIGESMEQERMRIMKYYNHGKPKLCEMGSPREHVSNFNPLRSNEIGWDMLT